MAAEIGHFALLLALIISIIQVIVPLAGTEKKVVGLTTFARPAARGQFLFIIIAFSCLMYLYVVSDFSVANVAYNSHTSKPLIYKITGVWGNHEGSMLLWVAILSLLDWEYLN